MLIGLVLTITAFVFILYNAGVDREKLDNVYYLRQMLTKVNNNKLHAKYDATNNYTVKTRINSLIVLNWHKTGFPKVF